MAAFIYNIERDTEESTQPSDTCRAPHYSQQRLLHRIPVTVTTPMDACKWVEENVLKTAVGATVRLFFQCEEWVPSTHVRTGRTPSDYDPRFGEL